MPQDRPVNGSSAPDCAPPRDSIRPICVATWPSAAPPRRRPHRYVRSSTKNRQLIIHYQFKLIKLSVSLNSISLSYSFLKRLIKVYVSLIELSLIHSLIIHYYILIINFFSLITISKIMIQWLISTWNSFSLSYLFLKGLIKLYVSLI